MPTEDIEIIRSDIPLKRELVDMKSDKDRISYKHNQTGRQKTPIIPCGLVASETSSQKGADCADSHEVKVQWVTQEWCSVWGKAFARKYITNALINLWKMQVFVKYFMRYNAH